MSTVKNKFEYARYPNVNYFIPKRLAEIYVYLNRIIANIANEFKLLDKLLISHPLNYFNLDEYLNSIHDKYIKNIHPYAKENLIYYLSYDDEFCYNPLSKMLIKIIKKNIY